MSFYNDFLKELKKRGLTIDDVTDKSSGSKSSSTGSNSSSGGSSINIGNSSFANEFKSELSKRGLTLEDAMWENEKSTSRTRVWDKFDDDEDDIAPVKESKLDFFQKGTFEDGYQFGDVTKAILGTAGDVGLGLVKGVGSIGEGLADLVTYGVAKVADANGKDRYADQVRKRASENFVEKISKGADDYLDQYSVLGRTSDSITQGIGQVGTIILTGGLGAAAGLGAAGTTALTTGVMGLSSMGSGMGEAYQSGATDSEALTYGIISGAADALTELMFGGMGKAVKATGLSTGLSSADDMLAKKVSSLFSNHLAKNLTSFGIKAGAEGFEEVVAGTAQALGKKLTYMSEEELGEILEDENLLEQFVVGSVTSGIAQSGIVPGMSEGSLKESIKTGKDFITGFSQNEQAVIQKEVENRIADQEKDGKKLTAKEKANIEAQVEKDLEKGYISTDTIEEVLGGETYKSYRDTIDSEDALQHEFDILNKMKQGEMTGEQIDRRTELKEKLKEIQEKSQRNQLKSQLGEEVFSLVQNDRLVESYNERTRRSQAFTADLTKYDEKQKAVIQKAVDSGILNNTNRTHEFVDMVAKISADKGVLFDFTNNAKLKESGFAIDGKTVNGYVTKDGITINVQSSKSLNSLVGHEITHVLEGTDLYTELQNVVVEYAKTKGDYQDRYDTLTKLYESVEGANIDAELTADLVGDYLFTDADFINNLSTNHRNVFQKIYDEVKYLLKVATAGSKEARELEKVKRAFEKAYRENVQTQVETEENSFDTDDVQYSISVTDKDTLDSLNEQVSRGEYDPDKNPDGGYYVTYKSMSFWGYDKDGNAILRSPMAEYVDGELSNAYLLPKDKSKLNWYQATETIDEATGFPSGLLVRTKKPGNKSYSYVPAAENQDLIQEDWGNLFFNLKKKVYKNGKWVDSDVPARYNPYEHSSNSMLNDQFSTAYLRDNLVTVKMIVPVSEDNGAFRAQWSKDPTGWTDWKTGTVAGKINKQKDLQRRVFLSRYAAPVEIVSDSEVAQAYKGYVKGTDVAIPDNVVSPNLLAELKKAGVPVSESGKVKYSLSDSDGRQLSKEQQDYFKDSSIRDKDGNLMVLYHGTQNDFTVFDISRSGENYEGGWSEFGEGIYLTPDKKSAEYYGDNAGWGREVNLMEVYADIKNPFNTNDPVDFDISDLTQKYELTEFDERFMKKAGNRLIDFLKHHNESVRDYLTGKGFDGVWEKGINGDVYQVVAYAENQIKNVDNAKPTADPDIRYSLSDSDGNELSQEQAEYFKDSKVRDENGSLMVMYHGTPNGDFTVFKDGTYFTDNKEYADRYQNPGASSISTGKTATNPKTFEVYLDIKKPFDINDAEARKIYIDEYIKGGNAMGINPYLSDAEYAKINTIDWTEGEDLRDFLIENDYDYDGLVLDEGGTGGYGDDVQSRGKSYVVFSPEQVKSIDNQTPTSDPDIRFSLSKAVEETKDLMALHNLHSSELLKQLKMGGMAYPSIAITKPEMFSHDGFGEVSVILHKDAIDPKKSKYNKIYSADAYTPTFPNVDYEASEQVAANITSKVNALYDKLPEYYQRSLRSLRDYTNIDDQLNRWGGEQRFVEKYADDYGMKQLYLAEKGEAVPVEKKSTETRMTDYQMYLYKTVADTMGEDVLKSFNEKGSFEKLGLARMAWLEKHGAALKDIYAEEWSSDGTMTKEEALDIANEQKPIYWKDEIYRALDFIKTGGVTVTETDDIGSTQAKIDEKIAGSDYKQWVDNLFSGIEGQSGIRNSKDIFTPSGNRRSFAQTHDPLTVDNIVKAMRKENQTGQGAFGGGSILGASAKEFGSIAEVKRNADKLGMMDKAEHDAITDKINDTFWDIAKRYANGKDIIDAQEAIAEAVSKNESKAGIARYLKQYDYVYKYTDSIGDEIIELRDYIRSLPTPYFEAKPRRGVGFDEVAAFVIPNNADIKLKQELLNRGYNIAEYDPKVEGDRQRVVNQFEEYKFSLSNVGEEPKQYGNYNVYGKDIALETAPVQETVSEMETVAEDAPVAISEMETTTEDLFPDNLAPVEQELEFLMAERDDLQGAMDAYAAVGDVEAVNQILPEFESIQAKIRELQQEGNERVASLGDDDVPPEMDAPYPGETNEPLETPDPFAERDMFEVGKKNVKAYMYENPEVKPFFQEAALGMLGDLHSGTRGEKIFNGDVYYESGGEKGWMGTKRTTTADIADLLDQWHYTYDQIEKGLNAIIEDNGKENNAVSKRIEFMLHDRLVNGYTGVWGDSIPANQEYINLLNEKQINDYSQEAFEAYYDSLGDDLPPEALDPVEDIAPVVAKPTAEESTIVPKPAREYEAINSKPKKASKNKLVRADTGNPQYQQIAKILDNEPTPETRKSRAWARFKANVLDKGAVFEDLSLKKRNRELMGKWNFILSSEARAQRLMGNGNSKSGVKSLNAIIEEVGSNSKKFSEYLYHKHNVDRMNLADRYEDTPNKPVFGFSVTSEVSQGIVDQYEKANPKFKRYARDVYKYMNHLRQLMVDNGVISQETADLWSEMYPHYVPIRRADDTGLNINVPLDTGRTSVNAPVKRATGGSSDILPLFDTMALRTSQTYKAIAKNSFGVELKNTLGSASVVNPSSVDDVIDSIDAQDGLLQENNGKPTFTVFENGEKVTFSITKDMYDALKPISEGMAYTNKILNTASNLHRGVLTEYNPVFMLTNAIKDIQDVLINSQHPARTYAKLPEAYAQMVKKGYWYTEYMENGGEQNTYFDNETNTFKTENTGIRKLLDIPPLSTISKLNNFVEMSPRLAEYIASREAGRSVEVAMLDAARVTTNFAAGGDLTKLLNRNGATFLNASVQGAMQQVRNVREAHANGMKGWASLATKFALAGLPAILLNNLVWDDDEEYEELSDYVKQNYYVVGKYGDGKFIRIPKGRTMAVIQEGIQQISNAATGSDDVDMKSFLELMVSNLAPNNPIENNILAPIIQVANNETWYGEELVPTRLQDLPAAEQFDESTDSFSKWLGDKLGVSPVKINYLLDQYTGGIGDTFLPMLTPEAESGDNSFVGNLLAPLKSKFTTDGVMNNQNVSDFYETKAELTTNAKASTATDEDVLMNKYMNSINAELSELYAQKREIQNSGRSDDVKYRMVREIQDQIVDLTREGLATYEDVRITGDHAQIGDRYFQLDDDGEWQKMSEEQVAKYKATSAAGDSLYATDGTNHYRWYEPGEDAGEGAEPGWRKVTEKELERQNEVTSGLGITPEEYWNNREEYAYAYDNPETYALAKSVGGYSAYKEYSETLYDIKADKDKYGKSISGTRKTKVANYIYGLDIPDIEKHILFKMEYPSTDTYNYEIIDYLNNRDDISFEEMNAILRKLDFDVDSEGNIYW